MRPLEQDQSSDVRVHVRLAELILTSIRIKQSPLLLLALFILFLLNRLLKLFN